MPQLIVCRAIVALDGHLPDRSAHLFDLTVRPRVPWPLDFARESLGETVFDVEVSAG